MTNEMILILKLSICSTLVAISELYNHIGYTFLNLLGIQEFVAPTQTSVYEQKVDELGFFQRTSCSFSKKSSSEVTNTLLINIPYQLHK